MRKSFILHSESLEILEMITIEEQAELFRAFRDYHLGKELNLSLTVKIIFYSFEAQFKRDEIAYEKRTFNPNLNIPLSKAQLEHREYLKTPYWKNVVKLILTRDNNQCIKCSAEKKLQVHHLTYSNYKNELEHLEDLVALCNRCHFLIHNS